MTEKQHPGISMHKLPVGGGFIGVVFAAGSALIFILGLPALWYFVAFSAALGVGVAVLLRATSHRRCDRARPISILSAPQPQKPRIEIVSKRDRYHLRATPRLNPT